MSEQRRPTTTATPAPASVRRDNSLGLGRRWVVPTLLACLVAIFALSLALAPKSDGDAAESFGGTDSKVTDVLAEHGVTPWFKPVFEPGSSEVESGLFALQAALGAGAFGFCLGNLRGRRAERERSALDAAVPMDTDQAAVAAATDAGDVGTRGPSGPDGGDVDAARRH